MLRHSWVTRHSESLATRYVTLSWYWQDRVRVRVRLLKSTCTQSVCRDRYNDTKWNLFLSLPSSERSFWVKGILPVFQPFSTVIAVSDSLWFSKKLSFRRFQRFGYNVAIKIWGKNQQGMRGRSMVLTQNVSLVQLHSGFIVYISSRWYIPDQYQKHSPKDRPMETQIQVLPQEKLQGWLWESSVS